MKRLVCSLIVIAVCVLAPRISLLNAAEKQQLVVVSGPTIVAFFPPVRSFQRAMPSPASIKVDKTCYGGAVLNINGGNGIFYNLQVVDGGRTILFLETDPGTVASGAWER